MSLRVLLIILLALSGCSSLREYIPEVKPVEVVQIQKQQAIYHPPLPNQVKTKPVEWSVLTPQIMGEYLEDLEKGEASTNVYYGVSPTGYENLSLNMAEVKRYIRQMLSIINYYQELDQEDEQEENEN